MKRTTLPLAIGAALATPLTAQAIDGGDGHNVDIYGRFQVELTDVSSDFSGSGNDPRHVNDQGQGRYGIFATEKLGNGLIAFGRYEWAESTDDDDSESDRDQYVGLKGDWGLFLAGRAGSPYKTAGGSKWDPFGDTQLEAENGGGHSKGFFGNSSRLSNVFVYASPNFNGFYFSALYQPENEDETGGGDDDFNGAYSIGANYKNGPLWLAAGYSDSGSDGTDAADDHDRWKLGGRYVFGNHTLAVQYEQVDSIGDTGTLGGNFSSTTAIDKSGALDVFSTGPSDDNGFFADEADYLWISYVFKMGNNELMFSYGNEEYEDVANLYSGVATSNDDLEITTYTLAARHRMSKTFSVFGGWRRWDVDNDANSAGNQDEDIDVLTVGIRKDFKI